MSNSISFMNNSISQPVKHIVQEVAAGQGDTLKDHQQNGEQIYLENDILFNLK